MTTENAAASSTSAVPTIIPSCTERDFFESIYPFHRFGSWNCVYCGDPIEYHDDGTVYVGRRRLQCRVQDLGGYFQLSPASTAPGTVNRCCSDRLAKADAAMTLGRTVRCPICGDEYLAAMVSRWQGSSNVRGYEREGRGYAVDRDLVVPALVPVERLSSRPR